MTERIKSILSGTVAGGVLAYFGTQYFFNPAMPEPAFTPMVESRIISTILYWTVAVLVFDWAVQKTGQTMHTALVMALSQILLVDYSYVMIGRRELTPAIISAVTLVVIWVVVARVYDTFADSDSDSGDDSSTDDGSDEEGDSADPAPPAAPSWGGDDSSTDEDKDDNQGY